MSRILVCKCGFYCSFGHSNNPHLLGEDPFYKYNPLCPRCGEYIRTDGEKVTFEELLKIMRIDTNIMLVN